MIQQANKYKLKIPSQTGNLELIREFISGLAHKVGFDAQNINKIELAVDEACTNVIAHAYNNDENQEIEISVQIKKDKFTVIVADKGKGFDFNHLEVPNMDKYMAELRVGGLGIYLIKSLMDEVDYQTRPDGKNEVRMTKYMKREKQIKAS